MKTFNALSLAVLLTVSTVSPLLASSPDDLADHVRSKTISASHHVTPSQNFQHSLLTDSIDYVSQYRVIKGVAWLAASISYRILPSCVYNALHNGYDAVKNWLYGPSITPHTPTDHNCNLNSESQPPIEKPQTPVPPRPVCDGGSEGTIDKDKQAEDLKPSCKGESDWTVVTYKKHRKKGSQDHKTDTNSVDTLVSYDDDDSVPEFSFKEARKAKILRDAYKKQYYHGIESKLPTVNWKGPKMSADYLGLALYPHTASFQRMLKVGRK